MQWVFLGATVLSVALAGRSPNADYIDQLTGGARYSNNVLEDARLDVPGLIAKYGYPIEVHDVVTEDGYILTMHRIPHGRDQNNQPDLNKPVVFVNHGMLGSSAAFVVLGPGNALAYLLAEEGYDVWLGNARGSFYSRRHQRLNPDAILNQHFWEFSWDEIGNYDLPASLDYIETITGQHKLHYIGHSQGGTTFLVLNALRPQYAEKFISFQALAPGCFFRYNENRMFRAVAPMERQIETSLFALRQAEIFPNRGAVTFFGSRYCYQGSIFSSLCKTLLFSGSSNYFNQTMMPVFVGHSPAGSSIRQAAHYAQGINRDAFRRYDHGSSRANIRAYGSATPPDYDLSKVTTRTYIHYSLGDDEAFWKDVELLGSVLPNAQLHKVDSETFDHYDFVRGYSAQELVYNKVVSLMKEAESSS